MATESTLDMITALRSCGLAPLRLQRKGGGDVIELSKSAALLLGSPQNVTMAELTGLGPVTDDAASPTLGAWLAERLSGKRRPPPIETIGCGDAESFLCVNLDESVELFGISPASTQRLRRELRHRFRNHVNTIVMNIELISMLANQAQHAEIARAADRIEEECRECIDSLELL
jgi:hypothetical protein